MRSDIPLPESCKLFLQMGSLNFNVIFFWSAGPTRSLCEFQCCAFKGGTKEREGELCYVWAQVRNFCSALGLKDSLKRTGIATHSEWVNSFLESPGAFSACVYTSLQNWYITQSWRKELITFPCPATALCHSQREAGTSGSFRPACPAAETRLILEGHSN